MPRRPCECQQYGKSAVCQPSGKCMVCGGWVDLTRPYIGKVWNTRDADAPRDLDSMPAICAANDRLLGEVDRLRAEIAHLRRRLTGVIL